MSDTMIDTLRLNSVFKFIGYINDIKNVYKNAEFSVGDILYSEADRAAYVYTDNSKFELLGYDDDTDYTLKMKPHPTNCVNCGAVLKDYKCEYCGTEYPRY